MLELDPAGERFRQLLDLVDDPPVERGIGEEGFPLVGQLGAEVGDDGVAGAGVVELGSFEQVPDDAFDLHQMLGGAEWDHRDPPPHFPLGPDVEQIEPGDMEQEARCQSDAVVGKARQDEPDDRDAVAGKRGGKDDRTAANAGIGFDRQPRPKGEDHRDGIADQRIEACGLEHLAGQQRTTGEPRQDGGDEERADELKAPPNEQGWRCTDLIVAHLQPLTTSTGRDRDRANGRATCP